MEKLHPTRNIPSMPKNVTYVTSQESLVLIDDLFPFRLKTVGPRVVAALKGSQFGSSDCHSPKVYVLCRFSP